MLFINIFLINLSFDNVFILKNVFVVNRFLVQKVEILVTKLGMMAQTSTKIIMIKIISETAIPK